MNVLTLIFQYFPVVAAFVTELAQAEQQIGAGQSATVSVPAVPVTIAGKHGQLTVSASWSPST